MASFECCHKCKPPKRKPGCHDHCPEYKEARAAYDEKMEKINQRQRLNNAINQETGRQVARATRRNRQRWGGRMNDKYMQQPGTPEPDSQFRLLPCPKCGGAEIEYIWHLSRHGLEWAVLCKTCGKMSRYWPVKHHAQIEWNEKERPSWERD